MKNYIMLILGIVLFFKQTEAQNNIIKIHPLHLLSSKLEFEKRIAPNVSAGVIGTCFFIYSGYKVEPYFRYYLSADAANSFTGPYVQVKGLYSKAIDKQNPEEQEIISAYGISGAIGYQFELSNNFTLDLYSGFRKSFTTYPSTSEFSSTYKALYCSPLDLGISLGYVFGPINTAHRLSTSR
ncbi:MAG: DUF3575 domain-containing protein [Bacteroidetes bacterium]|nr:DUF3575 domain-containing protein [Bacteroidota bacterium]